MEEGVRVSHFFPVDSPAELVSRAPVLPPENCLLFGPLRCGKTTLLFTFAANAAAACSAARSVVLCRRSAVEASPPLLPPERAPPGALARVDMKCAAGGLRSARDVEGNANNMRRAGTSLTTMSFAAGAPAATCWAASQRALPWTT